MEKPPKFSQNETKKKTTKRKSRERESGVGVLVNHIPLVGVELDKESEEIVENFLNSN